MTTLAGKSGSYHHQPKKAAVEIGLVPDIDVFHYSASRVDVVRFHEASEKLSSYLVSKVLYGSDIIMYGTYHNFDAKEP
jgi:hypothetical protein